MKFQNAFTISGRRVVGARMHTFEESLECVITVHYVKLGKIGWVHELENEGLQVLGGGPVDAIPSCSRFKIVVCHNNPHTWSSECRLIGAWCAEDDEKNFELSWKCIFY